MKLEFSNKGTFLVVVGEYDFQIIHLPTISPALPSSSAKNFVISHQAVIQSVCFSPDDKYMYVTLQQSKYSP